MFGLGMQDSSVMTFTNIVLGFEFESKIIPFGAKNFIESFTTFFVVGIVSIFDIKGKDQFRIFFCFYLVIGILSTLIMFKFPYKQK